MNDEVTTLQIILIGVKCSDDGFVCQGLFRTWDPRRRSARFTEVKLHCSQRHSSEEPGRSCFPGDVYEDFYSPVVKGSANDTTGIQGGQAVAYPQSST